MVLLTADLPLVQQVPNEASYCQEAVLLRRLHQMRRHPCAGTVYTERESCVQLDEHQLQRPLTLKPAQHQACVHYQASHQLVWQQGNLLWCPSSRVTGQQSIILAAQAGKNTSAIMLLVQCGRLQAASLGPMSRLGQAAQHSPVPACYSCTALPRRKLLVPRAAASNSTDEGDQSLKDEARLEALERGVKRKQGATSPTLELMNRNAGASEVLW